MEWLKTILGDAYTDDIDKKVSEQIGKDFVARADFNNLNAAKKALDDTVKDRDRQLEELKKVDPTALQEQIKTLQAENANAAKKYADDLKAVKIDSLLETRLAAEKAVNSKAVRALLDMSKLGLDGENLVGLDDQLKTLKESEKWAFQAAAPGGNGGRGGLPAGAPPNTGGDSSVGSEILGAMFGKTE